MNLLLLVLLVVLLVGAGLCLWRLSDLRADRREWLRLAAIQPARPALFDPAMLAGLPPVAQRYFRATIAPGTPLYPVAAIRMTGQFSLGDAASPNYLDMQANQLLAAPEGFVWAMRAGHGAMRISGSDSAKWTRFWLLAVLPVARMGGSEDHRRSAFGRYVAEAAFWTPAALLPGPDTMWQDTGGNSTRVTLRRDRMEQSVDLMLDDSGRPVQVSFMRWSDANPDKRFRLQPFGGTLSDFRTFEGFTLPTRVEAGNFFGTKDYFTFFKADVSEIRFADLTPHRRVGI